MSKTTWGVVAFVVVVIAVSAGATVLYQRPGVTDQISAGEAAETLTDSTRTINYCWSGTASSVDVTITNPTGGMTHAEDRANNQCVHDTVAVGAHLYMSVQAGEKAGTLTCTISSNSDQVDLTSSSGPYTIAMCSGFA